MFKVLSLSVVHVPSSEQLVIPLSTMYVYISHGYATLIYGVGNDWIDYTPSPIYWYLHTTVCIYQPSRVYMRIFWYSLYIYICTYCIPIHTYHIHVVSSSPSIFPLLHIPITSPFISYNQSHHILIMCSWVNICRLSGDELTLCVCHMPSWHYCHNIRYHILHS